MTRKPAHLVCRGLGCASRDLVQAHIVPRGFPRRFKGADHNILMTMEHTGYAKQQLGEYDAGILCGPCDNKIGRYDDYALEVLTSFGAKHRVGPQGVLEMAGVDGDMIAKFVLSVIWKASISTRPNFAEVSLGPYEDRAKDVLFDAQPLASLKDFAVLFQRYTSKDLKPEALYFLPARARFGPFKGYGFALAGFRIAVKVDGRPLPAGFNAFAINGNNVLRAQLVELERTPEFGSIAAMTVADHWRRHKPPVIVVPKRNPR